MKISLYIFSLFILSTSVFAQTTEAEKALKTSTIDTTLGWKKGGMVSISFTQVSLTRWASGGMNSIAGNGFVNLFANYKGKNFAWDNNLDLGFGLIRQGDSKAPWVKSDDKIDFTSKYGQKASEHWFYAGLLNFKSQFAPGFTNPGDSIAISKFLAPGYVLGAIGMDFKPNDKLTMFISPITGKATIVMDDYLSSVGAFGIDTGKTMRAEIGGYLKFQWKKDLKDNFSFSTRVELFANYLEFKTIEDVDVLWENILSVKISKYIAANITTTLLWDNDVDIAYTDKNGDPKTGKSIQFKEVLGIGFSYKF
jgi:hypothetical protein